MGENIQKLNCDGKLLLMIFILYHNMDFNKFIGKCMKLLSLPKIIWYKLF